MKDSRVGNVSAFSGTLTAASLLLQANTKLRTVVFSTLLIVVRTACGVDKYTVVRDDTCCSHRRTGSAKLSRFKWEGFSHMLYQATHTTHTSLARVVLAAAMPQAGTTQKLLTACNHCHLSHTKSLLTMNGLSHCRGAYCCTLQIC